jgi:hypothetical protein
MTIGMTVWSPTAHAATVKPVLVGLIDRAMDDPSQPWASPDASYVGGAVSGFAVNVGWAELQPSPYGPIQRGTRTDLALAWAKSHNARVRIRVFAGVNSPPWAMNLDGPPITLRCDNVPVPFTCMNPGPQSVQTPRFWGPRFEAAYRQMMTKLSAIYDSVPQIAEIVTSQCSTLYPETYLRQFYQPGNPQVYVAAGWTPNADLACLHSEISMFGSIWPTTGVGVALNPYNTFNPSTFQNGMNENVTDTLMGYCRRTLLGRCVLQNYSTRSTAWGPVYGPPYAQMYSHMAAAGDPLAYQTEIDARVGNLDLVLCADLSIRLANDIELPRGYDDPSDPYGVYRTPAQLAPYDQALRSGSRKCP